MLVHEMELLRYFMSKDFCESFFLDPNNIHSVFPFFMFMIRPFSYNNSATVVKSLDDF